MEIETRRCSHHSRMVNEAPRRRPRGSMVSTCTSTNKVLGGSAGKPVKSELQQQAAQLASHGSLWLVSQTEATILSTAIHTVCPVLARCMQAVRPFTEAAKPGPHRRGGAETSVDFAAPHESGKCAGFRPPVTTI